MTIIVLAVWLASLALAWGASQGRFSWKVALGVLSGLAGLLVVACALVGHVRCAWFIGGLLVACLPIGFFRK